MAGIRGRTGMPTNKTTHVRLLSRPLLVNFTRAQTILACDVATLYAAAATMEAGQLLTETQIVTINSVNEALGFDNLPPNVAAVTPAERRFIAKTVETTADSAAIEQRRLIASTVVNTLRADNWVVTVVDGGYPDRYTGIAATRGREHFAVAVWSGELIAEQASANEGSEVVEALIEGLREIGCAITIAYGR